MKRLKERAARQKPATLGDKMRATLQGVPKPMTDQRRKAFEALVHADVMALAGTGRMAPLSAADTMRAAVQDGVLGQGVLEEDRQLLLDVLERLSIDHLYGRLKLKKTAETLPAFTDAQVHTPPTRMGAGKFNTVFAVKLNHPDGSVFNGVFKPLRTKARGFASGMSGIPRDDPQTAMRNLSTLAYAKKLGFDVIVDTRVALLDVGAGPVKPALGLLMEKARGVPAAKTKSDILNRPQVCAELTKLQLLDHLTGQGDRHLNNYFIHIHGDGRARVTGIDNDQCFGHKLTDPAGIQRVRGDPSRKGFRGTGLPPVVDVDMARAIDALTQDDIRSMLGDKLDEAEVGASIQRLQGVKSHIAQLRKQGRVIGPQAWRQPWVQALLAPENSYVGRQRDRALKKEAELARAQMDSDSDGSDSWASMGPVFL
ncbi:hypothetical protein AVHM3334_12900 [Acidovorax sp. SUPP3334]|nr:hypothetical protein AVHM3334_12900 [Acidovorax sp. SUPP3334]